MSSPTTEPSAVLAHALGSVGIESPGMVAVAERLPADLNRGWSFHADAEFMSARCDVSVTHVAQGLKGLGSNVSWVPSAPGDLHFGQRLGLPSLFVGAMWETAHAAQDVRDALSASGFSDAALTAHQRMLGRLNVERTTRRGVRLNRPDGQAAAVFAVDHVVASSDADALAQQLALAARTFGVSQRQMTWFTKALCALCPRPMNLVTSTFTVSPRGLLPQLDVRIADIPITTVLKLYRQFSLLEEGAASRLGALAAVLRCSEERVNGLHVVLSNEEPPGFAIDIRTPNSPPLTR